MMKDRGGLSVNANRCPDGSSAEDFVDALHAQTDTEQRNSVGKGLDHLFGYAGILWSLRPRGYHNTVRRKIGDLLKGDGVVAEDPEAGSHLPKGLEKIERERIIVVDEENLHQPSSSA